RPSSYPWSGASGIVPDAASRMALGERRLLPFYPLAFSPSIGYSSAATDNSLSARLNRVSGLIRVLLGVLAFCRNHFRFVFHWNHFRVVMRSRRVTLAWALIFLETGLRRALSVGPEHTEGRSVQD